MLRNPHIAVVIFISILFKVSFLNIVLLANNSAFQSISTQPAFKVGKSRRRLMDLSSKKSVLGIEEDVSVNEKEENSDTKKAIKKIKFPFLTLIVPFLRSIDGIVLNKSGIADYFQIPNLSRTHLSISILRI